MKKALIALCAVFVLFCFRIDYLGERIRTHGADSLHIVDRVGIWLFNIPMAVGGLVIGAPEAAAETLWLAVPKKPDTVYKIDSDFPLKSERIQNMVKNYSGGRVPIGPVRMDDLRTTLALGGGGLRCDKEHCTIKVHVKYSNHAPDFLFINEAIFAGLQDLGWLHPYWVEYKFVR